MTMVGWQKGKMEEIHLRTILLRNPPNDHLLSSSKSTISAADVVASLPAVSGSHTEELSLHVKEHREKIGS